MRASSTAIATGAMMDGIGTPIAIEGARSPVTDAILRAGRILSDIRTRKAATRSQTVIQLNGGGTASATSRFDNGFRDGYDKGREDARDNDSYDPVRHSSYRSADRGYNQRYGSKEKYKDIYREGFRAGYDDGYRGSVRPVAIDATVTAALGHSDSAIGGATTFAERHRLSSPPGIQFARQATALGVALCPSRYECGWAAASV
jgi:hypothetical protein